ncbi:helix-turn-helix domain-containing protein [Frigidibacter mobilis]|uniref:helix-turn-helix domain-containing protein n=1 Tax=Frigidibacter mobilis TaxID=1335048 RepID=UPI001413771F
MDRWRDHGRGTASPQRRADRHHGRDGRDAGREAQRAATAHARTERATAYRGRKPSFNRRQFDAAEALLASGAPIAQIAKLCGVSRQTVHRFKTDPAGCIAALDRWNL